MMKDQTPPKIYYREEEIPLILSAEDVADILKVSRSFAYNLFYAKGFPAIKIGSRRFVRREKLLKWLEAHLQLFPLMQQNSRKRLSDMSVQ